ncbi:hypothetical protein ICN84_01570 [Akkermansia glycaniphila]|uniref:hypothetical protein n=1 Tax=Akkermansia glycaniphila TaxID=1679444 RepID=UPI001C03055C|nr:hypothetical protein [Akkermansia glycaniphila]MBT9448759.1 hypothetical protein [Akkermansia glycaniphila]
MKTYLHYFLPIATGSFLLAFTSCSIRQQHGHKGATIASSMGVYVEGSGIASLAGANTKAHELIDAYINIKIKDIQNNISNLKHQNEAIQSMITAFIEQKKVLIQYGSKEGIYQYNQLVNENIKEINKNTALVAQYINNTQAELKTKDFNTDIRNELHKNLATLKQLRTSYASKRTQLNSLKIK